MERRSSGTTVQQWIALPPCSRPSPTCRLSHQPIQRLCLRCVGLRGRCGRAEPLCTAAGGGYCECCRTVGATGKQAAEGEKSVGAVDAALPTGNKAPVMSSPSMQPTTQPQQRQACLSQEQPPKLQTYRTHTHTPGRSCWRKPPTPAPPAAPPAGPALQAHALLPAAARRRAGRAATRS